ncbi:hypothetical protein, partial [Pseudomonas syringae]|uniref:hypothetical protein n=1 Tax=Pseudomonas syringae TaxID=317 RepID=UPI0034D974AC
MLHKHNGDSIPRPHLNRRCDDPSQQPTGHKTEYLNSEDGLPHTIINATYKSKYLWWNNLAQVERFQDCSGK